MKSPCSICRHRPHCHAYKLLYRFNFSACPQPREAEKLISALQTFDKETKDMLEVMRANPWPFAQKKNELTAEEIALHAINGKEGRRLNLN